MVVLVLVVVGAVVVSASSHPWQAERSYTYTRKDGVAEERREAGTLQVCALYPCCCFSLGAPSF